MKFPPDINIKYLSEFCVCYYKDAVHSQDAPLHYHISVPLKDNNYLLFVLLTSQFGNKINYYESVNKKALNSIISLDIYRKHFSFLYKDITVIDCNQPIFDHKNEFIKNKIIDWDSNFKIEQRNIPFDLKKSIISALKASPIVKPFIKNLIIDNLD